MISQLRPYLPSNAPKRMTGRARDGSRATSTSAFCPAGEYQLSTDEQSPLGRPPSP
jgi:hypothetical protein